jgi:hypothetical protein
MYDVYAQLPKNAGTKLDEGGHGKRMYIWVPISDIDIFLLMK